MKQPLEYGPGIPVQKIKGYIDDIGGEGGRGYQQQTLKKIADQALSQPFELFGELGHVKN